MDTNFGMYILFLVLPVMPRMCGFWVWLRGKLEGGRWVMMAGGE